MDLSAAALIYNVVSNLIFPSSIHFDKSIGLKLFQNFNNPSDICYFGSAENISTNYFSAADKFLQPQKSNSFQNNWFSCFESNSKCLLSPTLKYCSKYSNIFGSRSINIFPSSYFLSSCLPENIFAIPVSGMEVNTDFETVGKQRPPMFKWKISSDIMF